MSDMDSQDLVSFLSAKQLIGSVPQSGQITGILKQMGDTMSKRLADATAEEESTIVYLTLMTMSTNGYGERSPMQT